MITSADDFSMLDLFRSDVTAHAAILKNGLHALEDKRQIPEEINAMREGMQAIRGGARIVELDTAVTLARAMENCFASIQKNKISLQSTHIDVLFKSVDALVRIAETAGYSEKTAQTDDPRPDGQQPVSDEELEYLLTAISGMATPLAQAPTLPSEPKFLAQAPTLPSEPKLLAQKPALPSEPKLLAQEPALPSEPKFLAQDPALPAEPKFAAQESALPSEPKFAAQESALPSEPKLLAQESALPSEPKFAAQESALPSEPKFAVQESTSSKPKSLARERSAPSRQEAVDSKPEAVDSALMELFLTEAETHVAVLNEGLLALEETPGDPERLEGLMRAAHSIKGGARVVGLDAAVRIAHAMEDCFSAAQKGELSLEAEQIDLLLRGADMLAHLSKTDGSPSSLHEIQEEISYLHTAISALRHAETVLPAPPPSRPSVPLPMPAENVAEASGQTNSAIKPASVKSEDNDRMVRVTASKIERLLGRAGEVVVNARWLPSFTDSLLELKRNRMELAAFLDELQDALLQNGRDPRALRLLTQAREKNKESGLCLADRLAQLEQFSSMSATHADRLYHEMVGVRMRPFADGARGFPRMVRDLARELGKKVRFEIIGKAVEVDQDIQEKLDAPLNHLLRNALDHGIELPEERLTAGKPDTASLRLEAGHRSGMLMISVIDDGRGIEPELLKHKILHKGLATADMAERLSETELMDFLFLPGFSTTNKITDISGRGVGLDVVHSMVHEVGGVVRATSKPGKGMTFHLELPLTLSVIRTFLVEIAGEPYAFPLARIEHCLELSQADIALVEDRQYFRFADDNIALVDIHEVLDIAAPARQPDEFEIVVVSDRLNAYGLVVDKFLGECELVVRPLDPRLGKVPDISATAVMQDGCPVLIFDVDDLVRSIDNLLSGKRLHKLNDLSEEAGEAAPKRVLVVDDSITVREMERKLLESHGYQVEVAVDGKEGWNAIRTSDFELLVSDVDMPRMNGIELISHVKQHEELKSIPVIIISYKDREEDRLRGLEAGANYYLTKSSFEDDSFINAVTDLIGEA